MFELKKIGIVKRVSAWLLDAILLSVLATGAMWIISLICKFDSAEQLATQYYGEWEAFGSEYLEDLANYYGFGYEGRDGGYVITKDGRESSVSEVMQALIGSEGKDEQTAEAYARYLALPPADKVDFQYRYVYNLLFLMVSLGLLISYLVLEFIIPLCLKNGQTVGKKVFGICLVRPDCVKIANIALFARTVLGKYAVETMFPVLLVFLFFFGGLGVLAIVLFAALLLLDLILFFATKNRTPIHDIFANTVAVDMKLQMIYGSEAELNAEKMRLHQERVEQTKEE